MKIVSPFDDYYDSVQSSTGFFDTSENPVVFVRNAIILNKDNFDEMDRLIDAFQIETVSRYIHKFPISLSEIGVSFPIPKRNQKDYSSLIFDFFSILFCGRLIRGIEATLSGGPLIVDQKVFYSADKFIDYLYSLFDDSFVNERLEKNTSSYLSNRTMHNGIVNYFSLNENESLPEEKKGFLIENKITLASLNLHTDTFRNVPYVEINPRLSDYQFQSFIDPYTAYQEIDMWISGTLAFPPNFMINVSDETLVKKHGFDEKYGFRKRPTTNKKRKRKRNQ